MDTQGIMSSFSDDDEEYRFFDANEHVDPLSPQDPDSTSGVDDWVSSDLQYDIWVRSPGSVRERRRKFFRWMDFSLDKATEDDESGNVRQETDEFRGGSVRITGSGGAVLRSAIFEEEFSPSSSSVVSSWSINGMDSSTVLDSSQSFGCRNRNPDCGDWCNLDEDSKATNLQSENFETSSRMFSSAIQQPLQRDDEVVRDQVRISDRVKRRWLSRLRSMTCVANGQRGKDNSRSNCLNPVQGTRIRRVKVRYCRKRLKELSGLFRGQDIQAHEGSILSMKFSLDGRFLASAGEDKIMRIWQVVEDERSSETDIPEIDPSCIYFTVNHLSELAPLVVEKEKTSRLKGLRKTEDSACIILPPKVFRIIEVPLHVFEGHRGEILDISWSETNFLLSSSVDKTVRLWEVGCHHCLRVFPHNNFVTCVQFNPVNDDYFISGSIDGKVRIWRISDCQVAYWIDVRDIVTAVSFRPDGQGGIVGSITGICRFFNISDNQLQAGEQICFKSKKKSPGKRITGFQFFPKDPGKVMVISADSQVRILSGSNVITKYKGVRNGGNYVSASLTSNWKYIVSASDDCNVYVWNCTSLEESSVSQSKSIRSFEFFSVDALIAVPWCGLKPINSGDHLDLLGNPTNNFPFSKSTYLSLAKDIYIEPIAKGSATWPEEKLPASSHRPLSSAMCKTRYKFLKASFQNLSSSCAWGLVIVTAGWDGRIRSFHNYGLPLPL